MFRLLEFFWLSATRTALTIGISRFVRLSSFRSTAWFYEGWSGPSAPSPYS